FPDRKEAQRFMNNVCKPAMEAVRDSLSEENVEVEIHEGTQNGDDYLSLNVNFGEEQNFTYQVWSQGFTTPGFAMHTPHAKSRYYRIEVYLMEGSQGYDLMGYTRDQVIEDILDQYERHMHYLHLNRESPGNVNMPDSSMQPPA
ncbi:high-affinity choline transporter BetT, partial [Halomonas sp. BBD48]|nr:high-affinity choline transporter BetT [Halomonas sp. BBD48]